MLAALPAWAQSPPHSIEEVVVTAQRRSENLQDVPVAVTAFTENVIEQRDFDSVEDIEHSVPGFVYAHVVGTTQPTLRGVGSDLYTAAGEPGVALYVDDIYLGRTYLPQAALGDVERIEVLRGPQGTLYGRNTSGGALKFVTRRPPDELDVRASFQYGSFDQLLGKASIGGPILAEMLKATASFVGEDRDGWLTNLNTGENLEGRELWSGRAAMDFDPLDWLGLSITGDVTRQEDDGPQPRYVRPAVGNLVSDSAASPLFRPYDTIIKSIEDQFAIVLDPIRDRVLAEIAGGRFSPDPREVYTDFPPHTKIDSEGISATLRGTFGPVDAKLIGGWRNSKRKHNFDADGSDQPLIHMHKFDDRGEQTSVELHLSSEGDLPFGLGRGRVLGGFYYYDEDASQLIDIALLTLAPNELAPLAALIPPNVPVLQNPGLFALVYDAELDTRSYAGFGEGEWDVLEWLTLRAGGRYTLDEKSAVLASINPSVTDACPPTAFEESFSAFTGKVGADVRIDDERMVYASFSQGFKAGGFTNAGCNGTPYDPERIDAYEIGFKSQWLERRLRLNVAAYYYSFRDIQVQQAAGLVSIVVNAAEAEIKGVEVEMQARPFDGIAFLDGFSLDGSATWLDAKYTDYVDDEQLTLFEGDIDLSGNRLPKAPEWSGTVGVQYDAPVASYGEATARVDWSYRGQQYFDQFNRDFNGQAAYDLWNAFLGFEHASGYGGFRGFVKNIEDESYLQGGLITSFIIGAPSNFYAAPRTWGIEAYVRF